MVPDSWVGNLRPRMFTPFSVEMAAGVILNLTSLLRRCATGNSLRPWPDPNRIN